MCSQSLLRADQREGAGARASGRERGRHAERGRTGCRQTATDSLAGDRVAEDVFPQPLDVLVVDPQDAP